MHDTKKMIEVVDPTTRLGDFTAVDHISFSVEENDIFAFLDFCKAHYRRSKKC